MLVNYFKIALRRLWSGKLHTAINVLGLAMSMLCCLVIYIFVQYEYNFDGFHTHSKDTFRIVENIQKADGVQYLATTAYPLAEAIRREIPGVAVTQTAGPISRIINSVDEHGTIHRFEEKRLLFADAAYLQTFDFSQTFTAGLWLAGNAQTAFEQPNAVVLTQHAAERYFAGSAGHYEQLLGKTLTLNNSDLLVISGVIRNPPHNTNLLFEILVNYQFFKTNNPYQATNWSGNYQGMTYVTLPPGLTPAAFERELAVLKQKYMSEEDNRAKMYLLQPLSTVHTETRYADTLTGYVVSRQMLWGLVSLAVFLLLIASFNFINLTTAQAIQRRKEVGVRKVVGSTQQQLLRQFLGETLLIAAVAGLLAFSALYLLLDWLNHALTIIDLELHLRATVGLVSIGLVLLIAVVAGLYPAIVLARFKPMAALQSKTSPSRGRVPLRQGLIVFQFCITYGLLIGTLVASRQMDLFRNKELGFAKDAVVTVNGPRNQTSGKMEAFRQQLLQNPGIRAVSLCSGAPITEHYYGTDFRLKTEGVQSNRPAEMKVVDLAYQSLFGLQIVSGNWLSQRNIVPNGAAFNGFVVNETMVKTLGLTPETAIGKIVAISEGEAPIVGVVKDFHNVSLQEPITPCVLMCWNTDFYEQIQIGLQSSGSTWTNVAQTLGAIEQTWQQLFPQDVYRYGFLDESLAKGYIVEQLVFDAIRIFTALSIFISCLGLFGLVTFMAEQRRKEIGVRKVLGASIASITGLLASHFLKLVALAILIATPVAWYCMQQWLADFAYRINLQGWMFVAPGLAALLIAFVTVGFQSIKAALADPVKSLRSE